MRDLDLDDAAAPQQQRVLTDGTDADQRRDESSRQVAYDFFPGFIKFFGSIASLIA